MARPPPQAENGPTIYFSSDYVAPAREDARVRPAHLADIAQWLAARFNPQGGKLAASVQGLNSRGGAGLAAQASGGRTALLRYAFNPAMIDALYRLYIDRFMDDLNLAARTRGFSVAQNRQFHLAVAGQAAILAQALEAVAQTPDLRGELARVENLSRQAVELNSELAAAVADERGAPPGTQQKTARLRLDGIAARYRRALDDAEKAKRAVAASLRKNAGNGLDDEALLFVASWVARRLAQNQDSLPAVHSAARALRDLARRCAESGG